jgi:hypothetical protein
MASGGCLIHIGMAEGPVTGGNLYEFDNFLNAAHIHLTAILDVDTSGLALSDFEAGPTDIDEISQLLHVDLDEG